MGSQPPASAARDYAAQYPDPIDVAAGESVRVERPDEENPSWWWCVAADGRAGWVPGTILDPAPTAGANSHVQRPYSARELSVTRGEPLFILEEFADWLLVRNTAGARGWVPASHVQRDAKPPTAGSRLGNGLVPSNVERPNVDEPRSPR